jgi:hypothetical protein
MWRTELAPIPLRWIPDLPRYWSDWRSARRNLRRVPEQERACREIVQWLAPLLDPIGEVQSWANAPRDDRLTVTVSFKGSHRQLVFSCLRGWPEIEPRDALREEVLELLNGADDEPAWILLGSQAEMAALERRDLND